MPKIKRPTIIYWLFDVRPETLAAGWQSGKPFYCGKTIKPEKKRLYEHKNRALRQPDREHSKRLLECGEHVDIRVIETVPPDGNWITRERHWIEHLRASFPGGTNISDGGEGGAGGGRPSLGKPTQMRLSPEMIDKARNINSNISAFIREAIEEKLLKHEKKTKKPKD